MVHRRHYSRNKLRVECLEQRRLLHAAGLLWGVDSRLSVSFVPDGTGVATQSSELFSSFQALGEPDVWQDVILRGLQTWAQHTNIDIGHVDDDGSDLGTYGSTTGDPRFGDIRIAAVPLEGDVFATTVPTTEYIDGTWVGDVIFNSSVQVETLDDLFAIAVHEAGHVFGMEHTSDADSPLLDIGIPSVTVPNTQDLANLHANFGPRQPDHYELAEDANEINTLTLDLNEPTIPEMVYGSLDRADDVDRYVVQQVATMDDALTVRLLTQGISQLRPALRVINADGQLLGEATFENQNEFGQVAVISSFYLEQGDLTVEVSAGAGSPHDIGGYTLLVAQGEPKRPPVGNAQGNLARRVESLARSRVREVTATDITEFLLKRRGNQTLDESILVDTEGEPDSAIELSMNPSTTGHFVTTGAIASPMDHDQFLLTVPEGIAPDTALFVSLVSLRRDGKFRATADVVDGEGQAVARTELISNQYASVVQVENVAAFDELVIDVQGDDSSLVPRGNYEVVVQFSQPITPPIIATEGILDATTTSIEHELQVNRTQLFRFGLRGLSTAGVSRDLIATIINGNGVAIDSFVSSSSEFRSHTVLLPPGEYSVRVQSAGGEAFVFELSADAVDEPIGVEPVDPTEAPFCAIEWLGELLACLPIFGDVNGDGEVDFADFLDLSANFGDTDAEREDGDLNGDQKVDFADFLILSSRFGKDPILEL